MNKTDKNILKNLLSENGIEHPVDYVLEIIAGIAAGPSYSNIWNNYNDALELISPNLPQEATDLLIKELERIVETYNSTANRRDPEILEDRLTRLRKEMASHKLSGFIVPLADQHQGEYLPKNAQRLAWLTGFTGSAGVAIILEKTAILCVDGRYTLQAKMQVNKRHFIIKPYTQETITTTISDALTTNQKLGIDPWLHTTDNFRLLEKTCKKYAISLVKLNTNLIDTIWDNQPPPPITPAIVMKATLTGKSSSEKRKEICKKLNENGLDACVLTAPDSIAWLVNIRGNDVPYTPFCLAFAVLYSDTSLDIYSDPRKFSKSVCDKLGPRIRVLPVSQFLSDLGSIGGKSQVIGIDFSSAAEIIRDALLSSGVKLSRFNDPCQLPKAIKNTAELCGIRKAHLRDGAALTTFLAWLAENKMQIGVTEISAAAKLEEFRRQQEKIQGLSFPTISGSGANGAIIHYNATKDSNCELRGNTLYLVDSGAQYLDGTTDVTRTIAIGEPSAQMKIDFTRVLKGHIAIARAVFPRGTSGSQLDSLARIPLWEIGKDYNHGTGHGVGAYLSVHEGPHSISKKPNNIALAPGMVISNEPGYYKENEYGIRIENLIVVVEHPSHLNSTAEENSQYLCFETLTLAPIDISLIEINLLDKSEIGWLDSYHEKVRDNLLPLLDKKTQHWLNQNSKKLSFNS